MTAPATAPSDALSFWLKCEETRIAAGYVRGREPPYLSRWFSPVMMALDGDEERLWQAWIRFGDDPFWEKYSYAFPMFQRNWEKFVPRKTT